MIALLLGMLLLPQAVPANGAGGPRGEDEGWLLLDGVAAQAGDGIVTMRELHQWVEKRMADRFGPEPITDPREFEQASNVLSAQGVRQLLTEELEAQSGEDMGLDSDEIERLIQLQVRDERRRQGAGSYVDQLLAEGLDPLADQSERTRQLYVIYWRRSKLGYSGAADQRPTVDRFIRPGELALIYHTNRDGLHESQVQLQLIVMPIAAAGGLEAAQTILEGARERAQAGEDFGDLVDELSSEGRDTRGLMPMAPVGRLPVPGLRDWAAEAPVGDLSPIVAVPPGQEIQWLLLARMSDRDDPPPPEFEDEGVQTELRRIFADYRDGRLLDYERSLLGEAAFSWLHPGLQGTREALSALAGR